MKLTVRRTLFLVVTGLVFALVVATGLSVRNLLVTRLEGRIRSELARAARLAAVSVESTPPPGSLDTLADELGHTLGVRVSIVGRGGRVLGDSELSPDALADITDLSQLAEFEAAHDQGVWAWQRTAAGADIADLFVAVPFHRRGERGVVVVRGSLESVEQILTDLRLIWLLTALYGLFAAVVVSGLATHLSTRALRRVVVRVGAVARGEDGAGPRQGLRRLLARCFGHFNRVAGDLEESVESLAAERARFEGVLNGMDEGVLALDPQGQIALLNPRAAELLLVAADAVGGPATGHVAAPILEAAGQAAAGKPVRLECTVGDDPARRLAATASPLPDRHGTVVVLRDVTELRRLETVRRDFVANASHELRTPVAVIRATTDSLLDGALDDPLQARRFLLAIDRNADRLARLVADVLDISRIEAGAYTVERDAVDVAPLLHHVVALLEPAARRRHHQITVEAPPDAVAGADASALEHVLFNLLSNAINYTPPGGHIHLQATRTDDTVQLHVRDNGPGIPPEHRARVFERFYRVDPARSREVGGTGLGLAIVRHLVLAMNGTIEVSDSQPHGTVFTVTLPSASTGQCAAP